MIKPLVRELGPNKAEVQRVMRELGFDYIQARNHVRGLELLRRMQREKSLTAASVGRNGA